MTGRPAVDTNVLSKRLAERADIGFYLAKACIKIINDKMAEVAMAGIEAKLDRWPMPKASRFEDTIMWLRGFGRLEVVVGYGHTVQEGQIGSEQAKTRPCYFTWLQFREDADLATRVNPFIVGWARHERNKRTNELIKKGVYSNKRKKGKA